MRFQKFVPVCAALAALLSPTQAHAFGAAWGGIKWTGRQVKKILPPYGNHDPKPLNCNSTGDGYFAACYFDDSNLSQLKATKDVANIDFNWGTGSPDPAVNATTFSARFTGRFDFDAAQYDFLTVSDDGVRLYIDDQLVIDQWNDHGPTEFQASKMLSGGKHKIEVEYYQNLGASLLKLTWAKSGGGNPGGGSNELDLHQATLEHMAGDFADWPITTHIKSISLTSDGVHVEMDNGRPDSWPDTPDRPGMGPLLYSMGLAENIGGHWYASAPVQLWRGLYKSGGGIQLQDIGNGQGQIISNWFYAADRWGPLASHQPAPGETIGLFICAGDCRDGNGAFSPVHERSNVVLFQLPHPNEQPTINFP